MKEPLVSVIIPTYNREDYIIPTVQSVLDQTFSNLEVIISDDGSTDNTKAKVKKLKDKRVKYLLNVHSGLPSTNRNIGIKKCSGDYIAFLDR